MKFLNRIEEQDILSAELAKPDSRFIVLYGRRRIGKSALLQHILKKNSVYYLADINEAEVQRSFFISQFSALLPGIDRVQYSDWNTLFNQINNQIKSKITICIDEFPNLVKTSPELPSVIQKIIDMKQNSMFHLILCGSSQQMMQGLVLDKSSPLFGRAHRIMKLMPMSIKYLSEVLKLSSAQAVEEYAVWGGIPRYWELRSEYPSLEIAIKELILNPYGVLHEEPLRLFMEDLRNAVQPISIASLIGQGCHKLSEIAARLNKPATNLTRPMQTLIETGYIKRDIAWGESEKNSKKTLYRLIDPLSNFFFTFIIPNQSKLHSGHLDDIYRLIESRLPIFVSETWEELCRQYVSDLEIDGFRFLPAQRWWSQSKHETSAEIDIICESIDGECLLIGESKWQFKKKPQSILNELNKKLPLLHLNKQYKKIYKLIMLPDIKQSINGNIIFANAEML